MDLDTSAQVRRALSGDAASLDWMIEHFTPFLIAQARYRIGRHLQGLYDPEDLVQRTWAIALTKFSGLIARDRMTPVVLRFLSAILLQDYRNALKKHVIRRGEVGAGADAGGSPASSLAANSTSAIGKIQKSEERDLLQAAIDQLSDTDREIVILRGVEQLPFDVIERKLGTNAGALRTRYSRALDRLKSKFPSSMIDEMHHIDGS